MSGRALVSTFVCVLAGCGRIAFDPMTGDGAPPADAVDQDQLVQDRTVVAVYETPMTDIEMTLTIAPVDPERTMVLCDYRTTTSSATYTPACFLDNPTTLRAVTDDPSPEVVVRMQVVQFPRGYANVQRGAQELGSNRGEVPFLFDIARPVDLSRSFIIAYRYGGLDSTTFDERTNVRVYFDSPSTIALKREEMGNNIDFSWQVVEIEGANVVSDTTTLGAGMTTASVPLPPGFGDGFVVYTIEGASSVEGDTFIRAEIAADTVTFNRNVGTVAETLTWFAVHPPNTAFESGTTNLGAAVTATAALGPVDVGASSVHLTASGGEDGDDGALDQIVSTPTLEATQLSLTRGGTPEDVGAVVHWDVVTWP